MTQQLKSPEFIALGVIFIGNVYALQLYLGTARIQLEEMGDDDKKYLQMLSFIIPGAGPLSSRCTLQLVGLPGNGQMPMSDAELCFCAGVFVFAPFNGFFLDRLGFGIVLLLINVLSMVTAVLQSISVLQLQVCPS